MQINNQNIMSDVVIGILISFFSFLTRSSFPSNKWVDP